MVLVRHPGRRRSDCCVYLIVKGKPKGIPIGQNLQSLTQRMAAVLDAASMERTGLTEWVRPDTSFLSNFDPFLQKYWRPLCYWQVIFEKNHSFFSKRLGLLPVSDRKTFKLTLITEHSINSKNSKRVMKASGMTGSSVIHCEWWLRGKYKLFFFLSAEESWVLAISVFS